MSTVSRITPNLFPALDGIVAASRTMIDREKEFQAVLAGLSDAGVSVGALVASNKEALTYQVPYLARVVHALHASLGDVPRTFAAVIARSEEHTSELQSLMRILYAVV